jgi:hypothetical protein
MEHSPSYTAIMARSQQRREQRLLPQLQLPGQGWPLQHALATWRRIQPVEPGQGLEHQGQLCGYVPPHPASPLAASVSGVCPWLMGLPHSPAGPLFSPGPSAPTYHSEPAQSTLLSFELPLPSWGSGLCHSGHYQSLLVALASSGQAEHNLHPSPGKITWTA